LCRAKANPPTHLADIKATGCSIARKLQVRRGPAVQVSIEAWPGLFGSRRLQSVDVCRSRSMRPVPEPDVEFEHKKPARFAAANGTGDAKTGFVVAAQARLNGQQARFSLALGQVS
jgi:hypothetical protein